MAQHNTNPQVGKRLMCGIGRQNRRLQARRDPDRGRARGLVHPWLDLGVVVWSVTCRGHYLSWLCLHDQDFGAPTLTERPRMERRSRVWRKGESKGHTGARESIERRPRETMTKRPARIVRPRPPVLRTELWESGRTKQGARHYIQVKSSQSHIVVPSVSRQPACIYLCIIQHRIT